jgi:hypothetical protein
MKKFFSVFLLIVLFTSLSFAQGYRQGINNLNIGIGAGLIGIYGDPDFPPISVGYQVGFHDKFSIGGIIGYSQSSYNFGSGWWLGTGDWTWSYRYIFIGARGEYHFLEPTNEFDAYGGLTLGYNIVSVSEPSGFQGNYTAEGSYALYGFHVGGRYLFTPNIGVFAELGYGIGYITVGVNFRL